MADYRDWCPDCGEEINFGGHAKDCTLLIRHKDNLRSRREIELAKEEIWKAMPKEEIMSRARDLTKTMSDFEDAYLTYKEASDSLSELRRMAVNCRDDFSFDELLTMIGYPDGR